ncbi:hypothetical protein RclHR1_08110007 [Rhizophagus clarus]|uniref:Uncharacterized protein n=1 Tax=Rhizophagus clarus TaxID=94130 RepID=A0A2Z6RZW7_9GLOM|nr:hypothetical protein RclHR1_08110006 [Rhizophagus clarus]GBC08447.1 hypothetical protein RclHR1_08110007 [Rhizophagus clarus]
MFADPKTKYLSKNLAELPSYNHQILLTEFALDLENAMNTTIAEVPEETDPSRSSIPAPQQDFNISETSEKPDSIIDLEPSCMITEDIPKISPSFSKARVDPFPSGKKSRKSQKSKIIKDKQKDQPQGQSKPSAANKSQSCVTKKSRPKVIEKYVILQLVVSQNDKINSVWDIMIYDIPAHWTKEEILNNLVAWGQTFQVSVKSQRKYQMVRV